jgi:ABC transporter, ATP-binding protein
VIELKNISKEGIVEGISISIKDHEKVVFLGKNGTGKTTLLYIISGFYLPDHGEICFDGRQYNYPIDFFKYLLFEKQLRDTVSFFESPNIFYEKFTIQQNLRYYTSLDRYDLKKVWELYDYFEIKESINKVFETLSTGTKQKILLSLALASKKEYILLDEPTIGLDQETKSKVYGLISNMDQAILISTHDIEYETLFNRSIRFDANHICEMKSLI